MNKFGVFVTMAAVCSVALAGDSCIRDSSSLFTGINFVDMKDSCVEATELQIQKEVTASMKYLSMAAFFSRDDVNRPGFAKLFFEAAGEEREHAYKLIEYLSMRGRYSDGKRSNLDNFDLLSLVQNVDKSDLLGKTANLTIANEKDSKTSSGLIALQNALKLETAVTKSIRDLVIKCESGDFNHYHFVDYLTGEFLEEQYKGQRDLAGKIATLGKMVQGNGALLGDFLFDKTLL